jgi:hypothetical protein
MLQWFGVIKVLGKSMSEDIGSLYTVHYKSFKILKANA